jgi:hypothetical protein
LKGLVIMMRLILKFLAAPFALAFTIAAVFFSFVLSVSGIVFGIASAIGFLAAAILFITGEAVGGIAFLAAAFLAGPFGLPALAGWFAGKLGAAGGALRAFIFS